MPAPTLHVCFVGTHDPAFGRVALMADGLRARGLDVTECVEPVWGNTAERLAAARRGLANPGLARRLLAAYTRLTWRLRGLKSRPDVLVVGYPGQLDTVVLRALFPRTPLVLDAFISLDETLADRGIGGSNSPARVTARLVDRLALRLADRVIVDTQAHARRFGQLFGLEAARTVVVPVGARAPEPGLLGSVADPARPAGTALQVLYFGGFIPLHGVPVILEAARLTPPEAGIAYELVGEGQEAAAAERFLAQAHFPHVRLVRQWTTERDLIARHIAPADVCLGIFAATPKAMDVVPAKVYLSLACGRPVVTADTPAVREEVLARAPADTAPLLTCRAGDPCALYQALVQLRNSQSLREELGAAGRRVYESCFQPERIVEPLVGALIDLARGR